MPTFEAHDRFWREYECLRDDQQDAFNQALREFISVLRDWERERRPGNPIFPQRLGITAMVKQRNIKEFAWAGDGRCTWEYGTPQIPDKFHVIWRRIGTHAIYKDPLAKCYSGRFAHRSNAASNSCSFSKISLAIGVGAPLWYAARACPSSELRSMSSMMGSV